VYELFKTKVALTPPARLRRVDLQLDKHVKTETIAVALFGRVDLVAATGALEVEDDLDEEDCLVIKVLAGHDLAGRDLMGTSDPFCVVKWECEQDTTLGSTPYILNTRNPTWLKDNMFKFPLPAAITEQGRAALASATLTIEVRAHVLFVPSEHHRSHRMAQVYDHDTIGADDFLGQATLSGTELVDLHLISARVGITGGRLVKRDLENPGTEARLGMPAPLKPHTPIHSMSRTDASLKRSGSAFANSFRYTDAVTDAVTNN
jgi:hypothetical protein